MTVNDSSPSQVEGLLPPGGKLPTGTTTHMELRELIRSSMPSAGVEKHLKACGLNSLFAPPPSYSPPGMPVASNGRPAETYVPRTPLEEALLCLLLAADTNPKGLSSDPLLVWQIVLSLSIGRAYSSVANLLRKHFKSENGNADLWLAKSHSFYSSGQHTKAVQTVKTLHSLHQGEASIALHMFAIARKAAVSSRDKHTGTCQVAGDVEGKGLKRMAYVHAALAQEDEARRIGTDMDKALVQVGHALDCDPSDYRILYLQARLEALNNATPGRVILLCQSALKAGGVAAGAIWATLAIARAAQNRLEKAIAALDTGLTECGPAHGTLLLMVKVRIYLLADEPAQALEALQQLMAHVQRGTAHTESTLGGLKQTLITEEVQMWIQGVHVFLALKQYKDAQFCVDRALGLNPHCADIHHSAGLLHKSMGSIEAASASFETALAINPRLGTAEIASGALHAQRNEPGDLVMARDILMSGMKHYPDVSDGRFTMGAINKLEGRFQEAEQQLKLAIGYRGSSRQLLQLLPQFM